MVTTALWLVPVGSAIRLGLKGLSIKLIKNMNPDNIPFNAWIVGPTNSGKTTKENKIRLHGCPLSTFIHSKTYDGFAENDRDLPILIPLQSQIDDWLEIISYVYEGTNTI